MDPELWELIEAGESNDEVAAILRLGQPGIVPEGVQIIANFGEIVTIRTQRKLIPDVRADGPVSSMKAGGESFGPDVELIVGEPVEAEFGPSPLETDQRRPLDLTATGKGVIIGAVDWGFDFVHPDFRHPDGKTRILALWDQRGFAQAGSPRPYGYGIVHTQEAIDRALASPVPYTTLGYHPGDSDTGQGAHGTHVLSIAAGNGGAGGPLGIAPEADLVLVHSANWGTAETGLGDSVTLLEGIDFILRIAGDRPCVINLSMGRHCGQHDGSSLVEQGLDAALRAAPGRAICQSAGNYYDRSVHAAGQLRPGVKHNLSWEIAEGDATSNQLEIWYSWRDEIELELTSPDGSIATQAKLDERKVITSGGQEIGKIYHRAREPNTLDNHIVIFLYKQAPAGEWTLTLIPLDIIDGRFHSWIERDAACPSCQSLFAKRDAVSASTTGTICNGLRTIAVGAYDLHNAERPIAHFSSAGPTRDGRVKPDLCAPGVNILAARSASRGMNDSPGLLTRMSGTSMAAPHATGTVALMFQVAPRRLRIEDTHTLLLGCVERFATNGQKLERGGSGYLDITAAVEAARTIDVAGLRSRRQMEKRVTTAEATEQQEGKETEPMNTTEEEAVISNLTSEQDQSLCSECASRRVAQADAENNGIALPRFVHRAESVILSESSSNPSARLIAETLAEAGHSAGYPRTAGALFELYSKGGSVPQLELVGAPGSRMDTNPQPGDLLCRLGEGGLAHTAVIAGADCWPREQVEAAGLIPEGMRPGFYAQVVEGGWQPRTSSHSFARLLTDSEGRVPFDQVLLRPRLASYRESSPFVEDAPSVTKRPDPCRERWLKQVAQYPIEVRNAIANAPANGWYDIVTWAKAKGISDESTLRRLIYFAFWGPINGYCEPESRAAKKDWDIALTSLRTFVRARPWPPLAQAGAEPCSKQKRKEVPDNPALDITGRYVGDDGKTYVFNQAGLHFECVRSWLLNPEDELRYPGRKKRPLAELLGDLRGQLYYFFNRTEPSEYGTIQQKSGRFVITYQNKDPETEYALKLVEQRPTLFLGDVHPGRLSLQEAYELAPLTPDQKHDIEEIVDKAAIEKLLDAYHNKGVTKASSILLWRLVNLTPCHLESHDQKVARQRAGEPCKPMLDRFHKVDLPLVRVHVQQILTNNKWTSNRNITFSHIQWIQRMFAKQGASTAGTDMAKLLEDYTGIKPIKDPDKEPENEYEFTLSLTGASFLLGGYTGVLTVEQTAGEHKWKKPKEYDIELGGGTVALTLFDVKIGAEYKGAAKTDLPWTENDIPGSVRFAIGSASVGMEIAGVQLGFMHVFGNETLPLMEVIFQEAKLGVPNINKIVEEMAKTRKMPHAKGVVGFDVSASVLFGDIMPPRSLSERLRHTSHFDPVDLSLSYKSDIAIERNLTSQFHFCLDDDKLTDAGRQALRMMCARYLPELMSPGSYLGVVGHADTLGTSDHNFKLSKDRADNTVKAIRDILGKDKLKIPKDHIITWGLGELIADLKTKGKTVPSPEDRRVQIFLNARLVLTLFGAPGTSELHESEAEFARVDESYVRWIQESLNKILGAELMVDGVFNPETRAAIRRFQRQQSLVVDGHVGPVTERELVLAGAAHPPTEATSELVEETPHVSPSPLTHISCPAPLVLPTGTPGVPPDVTNLIRIVTGVLSGLPLGPLGIKLPTAARFLDATEQSEAITIYGSSLDFTKIVITDGLGASGRPFTVAVPLASGVHVAMNLGDLCSWASRPRSETLIHELAHAWQSQHHRSSPTAYMSNSVACQLLAMADLPIAKAAAAKNATTAAVKHGVFDTSTLAMIAAAAAAAEDVSAYAYIPGKAFDEYAAEQIAQQVEHTYSHTGHPTPGVVALVSSVKPHIASPENERGLTVRSFHRKSTAGVVFV